MYKKDVKYLFEVEGVEIAAQPWDDFKYISVEETRKNGGEDCHMEDNLERVDGQWVYDCNGDAFRLHSNALADGILDYINTHPLEENTINKKGEICPIEK